MNKILSAIAIIFISLLFQSCNNDLYAPEPYLEKGEHFKVNLYGDIKLFDCNTQDGYISDYSGVSVSIEGTDYSAITDKDGNWRIEDADFICTDNNGYTSTEYTLIFAKNGYCKKTQANTLITSTIKECGHESIYLISKPKYYTDSLTWNLKNDTTIVFRANVQSDDSLMNSNWLPLYKECVLFMSDKPYNGAADSYKYICYFHVIERNHHIQGEISLNQLVQYGFPKGSSVYVFCAGLASIGLGDRYYYENGKDGKSMLNAMSTKLSNEIELVIP